MVDLTSTFSVSLAELRDLALIVTICFSGWKARGTVQPIIEFFKKANNHMTVMEQGMTALTSDMNILLTNHLRHIEGDLRTISGRGQSIGESVAATDQIHTDLPGVEV